MIVNAWNINGRWANHTQREKNLNTYLKKARRQKIKTVIIKDSRHSIPDKKYNVAKEIKKRKLQYKLFIIGFPNHEISNIHIHHDLVVVL